MNEKAIAAALEPLLDDLLALEKRVDQFQLVPGPQGAAGRDADPAAVAEALAADREFFALAKGHDGKDGANGRDGRNGKDGANGTDGKDGVNGIDGANGMDGANGKDGVNGIDGANGMDGANGKDGADGKDGVNGSDGTNGSDGAGIAAPLWEAGAVYRKGAVVVANIGQHFVALKDTASSTDDAEHWQRIGSGGFRHRGAFKADAIYADGDLFVKDFGTFCMVRGAPVLLSGRGAPGKPGERGAKGDRGDNGRDGATIVAAQAQGFVLVLVKENPDGSLDHLEADFGPAIRELLREALAELVPA